MDLENEVVKEIPFGVDEVPDKLKIFTGEHINYVDALNGQIMLNDLKGQLLNIVEGIGLPERQENAIKRQITNSLHDTHRDITDALELVRALKDCSTCRHRHHITIEDGETCSDCKLSSRGYIHYSFDTGHMD